MAKEERAQALANRILDHLAAEGFRDDGLRPHMSITHDGRVQVSLHPSAFGCPPCTEKGFTAKLVDSVKLTFGGRWCSDCRAAANRYHVRRKELTPRLKKVLEQAFTIDKSTPDAQETYFMITP